MNSWKAEFGNIFVGKRVLVTGASGFIGGHLCDALVSLGAKVHGLDRTSDALTDISGYKSWNVDLTDFETTKATLSVIRPQLIYHLASMVTACQDLDLVLPMLENNLLGTVHMCLAAMETDCKRIVLSSSSEEPKSDVPVSPYAAAKAAASMYAGMFHQLYDLPIVVARLFMAFGPRQQTTKLIPYAILALLQNQAPKISSGERVIDFVYVLDIVRGLLMASYRPGLEGETIELGWGEGTTIRDMINLIVDLSGSSAQPKFGARSDRVGEKPMIANIHATRNILGWKPRWTLRDGLEETIAWHQLQMEKKS